jgi:hypothetical protein
MNTNRNILATFTSDLTACLDEIDDKDNDIDVEDEYVIQPGRKREKAENEAPNPKKRMTRVLNRLTSMEEILFVSQEEVHPVLFDDDDDERGDNREKRIMDIIKTFFVRCHKYCSLRETEEYGTVPMFFVALESWDPIHECISIQVVKHRCIETVKGGIQVLPQWDEPWVETILEEKSMLNCMPYDPFRDYIYYPEEEEEDEDEDEYI